MPTSPRHILKEYCKPRRPVLRPPYNKTRTFFDYVGADDAVGPYIFWNIFPLPFVL